MMVQPDHEKSGTAVHGYGGNSEQALQCTTSLLCLHSLNMSPLHLLAQCTVVSLIQRQITRKWYKIELYLHGRSIESCIWSIERRHF